MSITYAESRVPGCVLLVIVALTPLQVSSSKSVPLGVDEDLFRVRKSGIKGKPGEEREAGCSNAPITFSIAHLIF
jgi:hypothetical protein